MDSDVTETWAVVPGTNGIYEVSDLGNVRSWNSTRRQFLAGGRAKKPHPIRLTEAQKGYLTCRVYWADGSGQTVKVHSLVMLAFVGPRPDGLEVRHLDGNPKNNTPGNLKYGTSKENSADRVLHGTFRATNVKLTEREVLEIRRAPSSAGLKEAYGVSKPTIVNIRAHATWKQVGGPRWRNGKMVEE